MGLTRTLLNEMVWPAFKAMKSYVKPMTIEAVQRGSYNRIATVLRKPKTSMSWNEWEDAARAWKIMGDSEWQFNKELEELRLGGRHFTQRPKGFPRVEISPSARSPESIGSHEGAHHIYSDVWTPRHLVSWNRTVREHGKNIFTKQDLQQRTLRKEHIEELLALKSHPYLATSQHYKDQIIRGLDKRFQDLEVPQTFQDFTANTEALAWTMQEILTPGQEITAPLGLIRGLERIFDARGLIDRVSHRLPPLRRT
jgi:hypothetical protein